MYGSNKAEWTRSWCGLPGRGDDKNATWSATLTQKGNRRMRGRRPDCSFLRDRNTFPYLGTGKTRMRGGLYDRESRNTYDTNMLKPRPTAEKIMNAMLIGR